MKRIFLLAAAVSALSFGGVAWAQDAGAAAQPNTKDYPVCSRTVTDSCINPSQAGHAAWHKGTHRWHKKGAHHAAHRRAHAHHSVHHKVVKKTTTTTTTTTTAKPH